jgi:hypothetical protein
VIQFGHGVVAHRIGFAQLRRGRVVAEQADVVRGHRVHRLRPQGGDGDRLACGIEGVGAQFRLYLRLHRSLSAGIEHVEANAVLGACVQFQHRHRLAVQPIRGPIRRHQRAVAPDRPQLLAADALPHLAATFDVGAGVQHRSIRAHHLLRHRRRLAMNLPAHPQQHTEPGGQQRRQPDPQFSRRIHVYRSRVDGGGDYALREPCHALTWIKQGMTRCDRRGSIRLDFS